MSKDKFENKVDQIYNNHSIEGDYGDLWNELEPRLPIEKRRKNLVWVLFGLIIGLSSILIYMFGFTSNNIKQSNDLSTFKLVNEKHSRSKSQIENQQNDDSLEELAFNYNHENESSLNKSEDQVKRLNSSLKNESSNKNIGIKKEILKHSKTTKISTTEYLNKEKGSVQVDKDLSLNNLELDKIPSITAQIKIQVEHLIINSPNIARFYKIEEPLKVWNLSSEMSLLLPIWKLGNNSDLGDHGNSLISSLELKQGIRISIYKNRKLHKGFFWGAGFQYSEIYERFEINNRVKMEEEEKINKYALKIRDGLFVASEKLESSYLRQEVLNYNKIRFIDFNPNIGYSYSGSFDISLTIKPHINLFQSYNGYMLDDQGLVINEGRIFDEYNFQLYGLGFHGGVEIPISSLWKLTGSLSYESRKLVNGETRDLQSMNILGIGLGIRYKIY